MPRERVHIHRGIPVCFRKVCTGGAPAPLLAAAEDTIGKLVHGAAVSGRGVGGEATVAHNLGRHTLLDLFAAALDHLEIRVRVRIDESWCDDETATVDDARFRWYLERPYVLNPIATDQQAARTRRRSSSID